MKAQKVDNIKFAILQDVKDIDVNICLREGELYLSISDIYFREGDKWYEIPLKKLEYINVLNKDPPELEFKIPSLKVRVEGEYAEKLLALRYLLLPYIEKYNDEDIEPIQVVLRIWSMGIQDHKAIADLLKISQAEVEELLEKADKDGLRNEKGLTEKGKRLMEDLNIGGEF